MTFTKNMFYKIKRLIPMMGLAALTTLPTACEDPEQETAILSETKRGKPVDTDSTATKTDSTAVKTDTLRSVDVYFSRENTPDFGVVEYHVQDSTIGKVYLVPIGNWDDVQHDLIQIIRWLYLEPGLNMSPKVHGRGDFNFKLGEASKVYDDSIWFTENGWTINKKYQHGAFRDIEIKFNGSNGADVLTFDTLNYYANDSTVRAIYLVPTGSWSNTYASNITFMRNNFMEPRIKVSPKIHGRGDFNFKLGEASKVPDDSIWFTKQGWTINKAYQNQNQHQK
ncbi:MAG: hypothetical protein J5679_01985 [Alphaproteobacteria bacterium]|nr:hypothetical protein [Alphaproteobacteria bacterium]